MNVINPYLQQYKQNQIETATPEQILILLYDGAIQFLNKAKIAMEEGNYEQFQSNIFSCEKIILEFMNTLDMELGGKLAETLYQLYDYLYNILVTASISRNIDKVDEVLHHLTGLRETWQKAIIIANAEKKANLVENSDADDDNYGDEDKYESASEDYDDEDEDDEDDEDEPEED